MNASPTINHVTQTKSRKLPTDEECLTSAYVQVQHTIHVGQRYIIESHMCVDKPPNG